MTYEDLNGFYYIKQELKDLEDELNLICELSANSFSSSRSGEISKSTESIALKRLILEDKISQKKQEALEKIKEIEDFINTIDDFAIKTIAKKRFILCQTFEEIGRTMYLDRTTVSKRLHKYLSEIQVSHKSH
ncbi:MAG: hypothetical protein DBY14_06085 [Escherichia coli]|nr:MAG: hypothetical protein DBY14_06085 [Escherichia coli]